MKHITGNAGIMLMARLFIAVMLVFIVQKLLFLLLTWQEGTSGTDCLEVVLHGLKLDYAVTAYTRSAFPGHNGHGISPCLLREKGGRTATFPEDILCSYSHTFCSHYYC